MTDTSFAQRLLRWFDTHGRHDLPWQHPRTAYRVWLSEVMLQQTQVQTVIPYFDAFLARFPTLEALATAPLDDVLSRWQGLGYYARARNLHRTAKLVVEQYAGQWPENSETLNTLPGIGRSTANAIIAQALNQRAVILDGNVKRVLTRHEGLRGWPGQSEVIKQLWECADRHTPDDRAADYTQAIMDLGASICGRKPNCPACPLQNTCIAHRDDLTTQIPARKVKNALPERHARVQISTNAQGELWLERRPERGLWGGLWCLPLGEIVDTPDENHTAGMPRFRHTFSHFHLWIYPERTTIQMTEQTTGAWVALSDINALGLPKPIRRYLSGCFAEIASDHT